jgi:hypothetical protein
VVNRPMARLDTMQTREPIWEDPLPCLWALTYQETPGLLCGSS